MVQIILAHPVTYLFLLYLAAVVLGNIYLSWKRANRGERRTDSAETPGRSAAESFAISKDVSLSNAILRRTSLLRRD